MPIDPIIKAMLDAYPPFPAPGTIPLSQLRANVRAALANHLWEVPLASIADRTIPGPGGPLAIRIYTPRGTRPFPVVVFFHGGGWVVGDLDTQDNISRALAFRSESVVVSVDYRLAPEHPFPAATDDAWAATLWTWRNAASIGADPKRIAVAGDSAGGVLACGIALRARDEGAPVLSAQVNFYGSCNYPSERRPSSVEFADGPILTNADVNYFWAQYLSDPSNQQNDPQASPFRAQSHANVAPAFIAAPEIDPTRDDIEAYGAKLSKANVPVSVVRYPGTVHGFVSWLGPLPTAQQAIDDASAWLRKYFARQP
jgi:acetyl esterase